MNICLIEDACKKEMWPIATVRHVAAIRLGVLSIKEKWELLTGMMVSTETAINAANQVKLIHANILPTIENFEILLAGGDDASLVKECFRYPWELLPHLSKAIEDDCTLLATKRKFQQLPDYVTAIHPERIFVEEGAQIWPCIINASTGPVYIAKNAVVMEGVSIRGPFALGEGAVLKMGARIYGPVAIGPFSVVGGEVKNSLMLEYSNKAHDGYLGDSAIGSWCNLGAGTTCSNVKNTAGDVHYHIQETREPIHAGKKAGLIMGDYSRSAINTSFNTGSMVGICCNIIQPSFPPVFMDDFTWDNQDYDYDKAVRHIDNWKKMKNQELTLPEMNRLEQVYQNKLNRNEKTNSRS